MTHADHPSLRRAAGLRWLARAAAVAMFALFAAFLGGEERPPFGNQPWPVKWIFAGWALLFVGYAVGWRRPVAGGALVLISLAAMYLIGFIASRDKLGPAFLLWAIPGVLYLAAAWAERRGARAVA